MSKQHLTKKHLVVLSFSQVLKTQSPNVSVTAFAKETGLREGRINTVMLFDQYIAPIFCGYSYINNYKLGKINDTQFFEGIRHRLNQTKKQLPDNMVKKCWNAMCNESKEGKQNTSDFITFLDNNPEYTVIFVNETNSLQHQQNLKNLDQALNSYQKANPKFNIEHFQRRIKHFNSYHQGYFGKKELAQKGIKNLQKYQIILTKDIDTVVSLHKSMPAESLLQEGQKASSASKKIYINVPTNSNTDIATALKKANVEINNKQKQMHVA